MKTRTSYLSKFILILSIITFFACVDEISHSGGLVVDQEGMLGLKVPNGFDYKMTTTEDVAVRFAEAGSRSESIQTFQYAIIGKDLKDQVYGLKSGFINPLDGLEVVIDKPLHLNKLYLYTKYQGNAKFFELGGEVLSLSMTDLEVSDEVFEISSARKTSVPSCTSFLGNATKIVCKDNAIILKSSASFLYVDVHFLDGTTEQFYPDSEGTLNANQNQWTFEDVIGTHDIQEANTFTVYANCQTFPHMVGTELVTFANPCNLEIVDSDQDGIADVDDVAPTDPDIANVAYYPAKNREATFAFEDLWPYTGDYDFNDLVVSHQSSIYSNTLDMVTKVDYNITIRAVGAKFNNDLCISFTDPLHTMQVGNVSPSDINYQKIMTDGLSEVRFPQFKELFNSGAFINTDTTKAFIQPIDISFSIEFDGTTHMDDFEVDEFIRINQEEGRELHKPGTRFTSLFDRSLIGYADDDTKPGEGKYYKTANNLPWVLEIPAEWEYPKEKIDLTEGYPNFRDFAQGTSQSAWYTDDVGNKVHKNLYHKPIN